MSELKEMMKKKLGFGCMRLPVLLDDVSKIDDIAFEKMIDAYLKQGFCYFDTAYPYHNGNSESAIGRCLVSRYARESFFLASKMPVWLVKEAGDYQTIFDEQKKRCQVDYFDFYLLHAMNRDRVKETEEKGGFAFLQKMKAEGSIRHIGFSFHDTASVLEDILSKHKEMEFVQLQINYYDWESKEIESRKCYEVAEKYGIPVIVMEPVKGGTLANMVGKPAQILKEQNSNASYASFAIRYAASLENVMLVLSGMSNQQQLEDNMSYMKDFLPLSEREQTAIAEVVEELHKLPLIPCTKCRYCVEECPQHIKIPELFEDYNMQLQFGITEQVEKSYREHIAEGAAPEDCIKCGKCEAQCPQHIEIRKQLMEVAKHTR